MCVGEKNTFGENAFQISLLPVMQVEVLITVSIFFYSGDFCPQSCTNKCEGIVLGTQASEPPRLYFHCLSSSINVFLLCVSQKQFMLSGAELLLI